MPFIRHKTKFYLKKGLKTKNKTFYKDPLFCLGVCSFVFLFGIVIFCPKLIIRSFPIGDFSFLTIQASVESSVQNLFVEPVKNTQKDSSEIVFLQENSAIGAIPPVIIIPKTLGSLVNYDESFLESEDENKKSIIEYIVEEDDTLSSIAKKFDISTNTILWANNLNQGSVIKPGQKLIILPVSGVLYYVKSDDTLSEIAKKYKGDVGEIISFNELSGEEIFIGDILIIPNGQIPAPSKTYAQPQAPQIPITSSSFIYPTEGKISQGLHFSNAIDIANQCGTLVVAAAGGTVLRTSWNSVGGNYITISHPNGTVTYYGHLSAFLVKPNDLVTASQAIGRIGRTGRATGCHLHFEVRGARNFLSDYPLGSEIKWKK